MVTEKQTVENFRRRGESYKEGMLLLIAHLTDQDWKVGARFLDNLDLIKKNIEKIYEYYANDLHEDASFDKNKKHFNSFLQAYNDILLQHTTLKDPFKSLLLAECCSVWKKGREYFETPGSSALVQSETPWVDSEILLQEYAEINSDTPPLWFQRLALWQQDFIKVNWKDLCTKSIPSSLRWVPGIANLLQHDFFIKDKRSLTYFRHATPAPINLLKQAHADEESFRLTCLNLAFQIRLSLEQQLNKANAGKIREAVILTQSLLSPGIGAIFTSDNEIQIYNMKEKAVKRFQKALNNPTECTNKAFLAKWGLIVQHDGSLKYKGQSFGKITLLSTNHPLNVLRRFGVHMEQTKGNDFNTALLLGAVKRYLSSQVSEEKAGYGQGQSVNYFDVLLKTLDFCSEKRGISSSKKEDLIKTLAVLLSDEKRGKFNKNTLRLFDALQTLLSIPSGQGSFEINDKRHRQSLVSAMEAIIINCIGATLWVACKSGKDRTGGASAAYDAAATFYALRGRHPRYNDVAPDRALYLKLYKALFESGHHQKVASQNAIGAEGLIGSNLFLPDDLKLDTQQVQLETQLARLNKPKLLSKRSPGFFANRSQATLEKEPLETKSYLPNGFDSY